MKRIVLAAVAATALCAPANAGSQPVKFPMVDWQYVKWGMTADQVMDASQGHLVASTGEGTEIRGISVTCASDDQKPIAYDPRKTASSMITVICAGPDGKVSSITGHPFGWMDNHNTLMSTLSGIYGKPLSIEGKGSDVLITVTWRNEKERSLLRLIKNGNKNMLEYRAVP
jgi:hypothetical protein